MRAETVKFLLLVDADANAPGIDENGNPADPVAISEDVIGANEDGTEG